jgi:nucleoside-diphosphate-sugar epimerase
MPAERGRMQGLTLVTGATGFVGRYVCRALEEAGIPFRMAVRAALPSGSCVAVGSIGPDTDWVAALEGVEVVVHLAARVHQLEDTANDPLAAYREVNTAGTIALAEAAERAGVRRMVFMSTVKVHGESTSGRSPFSEQDHPAPSDPYGISKLEAESALGQFHRLQVTILRPPLVYGPGVGANFLRLLRAADRRIPLPLPREPNRRSLVFAGNLADAVLHVSASEEAAGRTFLVSDGSPVSTRELVEGLSAGLGRTARIIPVPRGILRLAATLTGRMAAFDRVTGDLEIDSSEITRATGWVPKVTFPEALAQTCEWYGVRMEPPT